jgi:hypothetical protein
MFAEFDWLWFSTASACLLSFPFDVYAKIPFATFRDVGDGGHGIILKMYLCDNSALRLVRKKEQTEYKKCSLVMCSIRDKCAVCSIISRQASFGVSTE